MVDKETRKAFLVERRFISALDFRFTALRWTRFVASLVLGVSLFVIGGDVISFASRCYTKGSALPCFYLLSTISRNFAGGTQKRENKLNEVPQLDQQQLPTKMYAHRVCVCELLNSLTLLICFSRAKSASAKARPSFCHRYDKHCDFMCVCPPVCKSGSFKKKKKEETHSAVSTGTAVLLLFAFGMMINKRIVQTRRDLSLDNSV